MSLNKPLLKTIKALAKESKVEIFGWGKEAIFFRKPADEADYKKFSGELERFGLKLFYDKADEEMGGATFVTSAFVPKDAKTKSASISKGIIIIMVMIFAGLFLVEFLQNRK